ncbi:uncharacterized protein I206_100143 [Kwoniella pini CBS 10737]|uniref:Nuclear GTP-binding protein n=1 Tax=Kwoniella pini CBS 10737 TaxID=1296096 RepID=A0A1B9IEE6_9TREE|nr:nuclear GTP-binding protein [Kwoniella pini CBS 10737]OCF53877.1 nuclear GTP-binding protein [Kwoniella pini CBS 10737]
MPRIRKQTTNRQTTRDRAKIHKKSVDNKRKTKKAAKKDQTWKSKKKQDPGIPNSFPFKDQILAELAEERRKAEEEKFARREAAKAAKSAPPQEEEEGDTPGIISLAGSVLSRTAPLSGIAEPSTSSASVAVDVPDLIDTALATLQDVIDRADVVCQVVDARDILGGRSGHVEGLIKEAEGRVVLLVNKIDLVPREALQSWLSQLDIPTFLFKSSLPAQPAASSSKIPAASSNLKEVWGKDELYSAIKTWSAEKQAKFQPKSKSRSKAVEIPNEPLVLAFMGLPSVGKTSILNSLLPPSQPKHAVAPYIPTATSAKIPEPKTKAPVEIEIDVEGEKIRIIDTPGWEYAEEDDSEEDDEDDEEIEPEKWDALESKLAGDLLRRNLGRVDKVKDALPLVNYIVKRSNHQDLMLAYNVPYFEAGDLDAFLTALARAQGRIKKHGTPDLEAAARVLLRDWAYNTFPYYTAAPKSTSMDIESTEKYDMSRVLEKCKAKKELKKENGKGLIRFKGCQEVDKRDIILDDDYTAMAGPSDEEDEEEEDEDEDELDDEDDNEDDEDEDDEGLLIASDEGEELDLEDGPEPSSGSDVEEEDEEESEPEPEPIKKRKRASLPAPSKKAKRVSFAKDEKPLKGILKRKRN